MPPLTSRHPSLLSSGLSRGQATSLRSALPDQLEAWAVCRPGILASQSALRAGVSLPAAGPAGVGEGPDPPAPSAQNQLDTQRPLVTESVKRAVVNTARDSWEVYFSRLFPATVRALPARPAPSPASPPRPAAPGLRAKLTALSPQGSVGTGVQILAVAHTGIKLLQMARGSREASGRLRVLRTYRCGRRGRARWARARTGFCLPHRLSPAAHGAPARCPPSTPARSETGLGRSEVLGSGTARSR